MTTSRRQFLKSGTTACLATVFTLGMNDWAFGQVDKQPAKKPGGTGTPTDALASLNKEDFDKYIYTPFTVKNEDGATFEVELVNVENLFVSQRQGLEGFTLVFRGFQDAPLGQDTYSFEHAKLGTFKLFIVPGQTYGRTHYYEAVINRLPN